MPKKLFFLLTIALVFLPLATFAAVEQNPANLLSGGGGGLVPQCEGPFCRACDLLELANNVINFGVAFSVIVATLMFAYAGIMYVSAASSEGQIKKAHGVFINVFVGLLLVLLSWLLVNILFSVLTGKGLSEWTKISCIANPVSAGFADVPDLPQSELLAGASSGSLATSAQCSALTSGYCSPSNLTGYFGSDATTMSSICHLESEGRAGAKSGTDRLWYDPQKRTFSVGLFQINLTQHDITCGGRTYDCTSAFKAPSNPKETRQTSWGTARSGTGFGYTIINTPLYNTCVAQASNPTCNLQNAKSVYNSGGIQQGWGTSLRRCGLN